MTTLSCQQIRERLVDGDEDPTLRAHAEACAECQPILLALSDLDADLEAMSPIDAPDALVETTLARVRETNTAEIAQLTVGAPSLLGAAFAMLTSAIGALLVAPLIAIRWLLGVGTERAKASIEDRGKTDRVTRGFRMGLAPTLAFGSTLIGVIAFATWQTLGVTVGSRTRGAEGVVNALPIASHDGYEGDDRGYFEANLDQPTTAQRQSADSWAARAQAPSMPTTAPAAAGLGDWQQADRAGAAGDELTEADIPAFEHGALGAASGNSRGLAATPTQTGTFGWDDADETLNGIDTDRELAQAQGTRAHQAAAAPGLPRPTTITEDTLALALDGRFAAAGEGAAEPGRTLGPTGTTTGTPEVRERVLRGGRDERDSIEDGEVFRSAETTPAAPSYWDLAQATSGLTFASSQSWWANTYVPGDARLRVLHARLAASPSALPGGTLSALALAESAAPTVPAVAAPTDRALAIGVHADTTAIEGPTRVRMEIALRAIDQAAGRRGALRIALVVDARGGLGTEEAAHLRSLLASLSHSLSPRDRVVLTAAGPGGGTLVPLGVLRHGQVEVALRHLASTTSTAGEAIATSLEDALAAGLEAVAVDDDGAGLALLVTPNGSHDGGVDQALHLGAVAGVPTTAVGIGTAATTSSLDAIALAGEGRRRMVLSDDDATRAVREELTAASRLVARALRVRIRLADGVQLIDVVGSHSLDADETRRTRESERAIDQELARRLGIGQDRDEEDSGVRILVPSFYAGDSHTIVLDLLVTRPGPVADVDVRFKDLVRLGNGTASSALSLEAGTEPRGPHELRVVASYVAHDVAGALDEAADRLERGDAAGARAQLTTVRALLDQARASVDGLASVSSIRTDSTLLDRFIAAIDAASDPALVASSLHYAAARRIVIPQLQASP